MMSRLKSKLLFSLRFLLIFTLVYMIVSPAEADRLTVTARKTSVAPRGPDDQAWQRSAETRIPVKGRDAFSDEEGFVRTQALYTNETLYFRFRWADPTQSTTKQSWVFDGAGWRHLAGNEDRIALLFEITRINNFATRGCAVTCHSPADLPKRPMAIGHTVRRKKKGISGTGKPPARHPTIYADDAWLTVAGNPSGSYRETGRRKDQWRRW